MLRYHSQSSAEATSACGWREARGGGLVGRRSREREEGRKEAKKEALHLSCALFIISAPPAIANSVRRLPTSFLVLHFPRSLPAEKSEVSSLVRAARRSPKMSSLPAGYEAHTDVRSALLHTPRCAWKLTHVWLWCLLSQASSGRVYYVNSVTGQSSWTPPPGANAAPAQGPPPAAPSGGDLPPGTASH